MRSSTTSSLSGSVGVNNARSSFNHECCDVSVVPITEMSLEDILVCGVVFDRKYKWTIAMMMKPQNQDRTKMG